MLIQLYKGLLKLAKQSGTAVVGGNMSSSPHVFVDVMVIGKTGNPEGKYLTRSSAKPGDKIAVTGWLGTSAAGLEMLTKKLKFDARITTCLRQAFAQPEPRLPKDGYWLKTALRRVSISATDCFPTLGISVKPVK